ncbi:hypothetical protein KGD83_12025 [Nocardiopsis akebiae]|uniref:Uncharacterized protein n=1 Tax=Nocardiopsis akebiae TaxID=2831968 RepID=A0ABX8CEZ2_9ACTN|nr:hypothetical protein [Nocardiopsis akebiae]QUX31148.1 hypothetical protein KGD83_12025 [Nocardiopsis akebiae]
MLIDPHHRDDRLARIATSWTILEKALRRGEEGWRSATPSHGVDAPSQYAHRWRLAALRDEQKLHHGWDNARLLQIELTVDAERTTAIQTLSGDHHTGSPNPAAVPRNRHPRGPKGQRLLTGRGGHEQLALFPETPPIRHNEVSLDGCEELEVWVLLVHRVDDSGDGRVFWHSELSRPHPPDARGYITGWHERVPLPALEIGAVALPEGDEEPEGLDVPVNFR